MKYLLLIKTISYLTLECSSEVRLNWLNQLEWNIFWLSSGYNIREALLFYFPYEERIF